MLSFKPHLRIGAALLALAPLPTSVFADDREPAVSATEEGGHDTEQTRAERKRKRARAGVGFSAAAAGTGAMLLGFGFGLDNSAGSGDFDNGKSGRPLIITGGVLMACGALVGIPVSAVKLRHANREIENLEPEPRTTTLRIGPTSLTLRHRF